MNNSIEDEKERSQSMVNIAKRVAASGLLIPIGLILSYLNPFAYITIIEAKINPFAHYINSISGVLIGFSFSVITASAIAALRFTLGIGTINAFHGGISGALIVGLISFILRRKYEKYIDYAALFEPLGTIFIGGTIAYLIQSFGTPLFNLYIWWGLFAASCIPGSIMGFLTLKVLNKAGISWKDFV